VDQYQGRDKSVIIYTCTKIDSFRNLEKDKDQPEGSPTRTILHDMRRLTVAVTRAKHKLIIIGHGSTLHQYAPFAQLMDNLESDQRVIVRNSGILGIISHFTNFFFYFSLVSAKMTSISNFRCNF